MPVKYFKIPLNTVISQSNPVEEVAIPTLLRNHDMTCWQVYINGDNNLEFIFWWLYGSNNWVRIYDMDDELVFEKELEYGDPVLEVDLPDGFYTVRTYFTSVEPIQKFLIGKP